MRFSKFAEQSFERACSAVDAYATPPEDDYNGWDFLVEFAEKARTGHSDVSPPPLKAFVQVKSTIGHGRSCRVKLSNALRAAQSPLPWFVVLFISPTTKGDAPTIYATHVWSELIERTLREVRRSESVGDRALHKKYLTIKFGASDKKAEDNLVQWMESCIASIEDYSQQKRTINGAVGFEDGHAVGELTFRIGNEDRFYDHLLGLGEGLENTAVAVTLTRFGIRDGGPLISSDNATVYLTANSVGECEIRLRGQDASETMSIHGDVYTVGEPFLPVERRRFRFSGTGVEIVWSSDGYSKIDLKIDFNVS